MRASSDNRLPCLDGWRAISIVMVLGSHSRYTIGFPEEVRNVVGWVFNGSLGVRVFFIISGLLITWLMLKERQKSGGVSLHHFYARRALRILPVYSFFLLVVAALQWMTPFSQPWDVWLANLTFTTGLFSQAEQGFTTAHLWSLAVEEQFYIIWPIVFVAAGLGTSLRKSLLLLALPVGLAPIFRVVGYLGSEPAWSSALFSHFAFTYNVDSLAIGCAAGIVLFSRPEEVKSFVLSKPLLLALFAMLLIVVPEIMVRSLVAGWLTVPFGYTLQAIGAVVLILQSMAMASSKCYNWLNLQPVVWVGTLSYSLYIWQQLFCSKPESFGWDAVWWMSWPGWLVATFAVAASSYYFLEMPFLKLRAKLRT